MVSLKKALSSYDIWSRNIFPFNMEGCVLYLPLWQEDMQGSPILSYDQYHHSCTVTGALWKSYGRFFDKIDDRIIIPPVASLNNLTTMTILAWVNGASAGETNRGIILTKTANAARSTGWILRTGASGILDFFRTDDGAPSEVFRRADDGTLSYGAFHFVEATWDGVITDATGIHIYVDLVEAGYQTTTNGDGVADDDSTSSVTVGNEFDGASTWDDLIGEVWLFNRVLSTGERTHVKNTTASRYL